MIGSRRMSDADKPGGGLLSGIFSRGGLKGLDAVEEDAHEEAEHREEEHRANTVE